jgi:hypothetical protein
MHTDGLAWSQILQPRLLHGMHKFVVWSKVKPDEHWLQINALLALKWQDWHPLLTFKQVSHV